MRTRVAKMIEAPARVLARVTIWNPKAGVGFAQDGDGLRYMLSARALIASGFDPYGIAAGNRISFEPEARGPGLSSGRYSDAGGIAQDSATLSGRVRSSVRWRTAETTKPRHVAEAGFLTACGYIRRQAD